MMRFQIYQFFFAIICITITCKLVSGQMDANATQHSREFFSSGRRAPTTQWFFPPRMSEHAKFLLCVDVYQKMLGIHLFGAGYIYGNRTAQLPPFEWRLLTIITKLAYTDTANKFFMHCPLHLVQFSALNFSNGREFYISEDPRNLCVYVLTPSSRTSGRNQNLEVVTRVCGLNQMKWTTLRDFNVGVKFITCLEVHEKLTRTQLYSNPFTAFNTQNNIPPIFDIVDKNISLLNGTEEEIILNFEVLYCPLDEFKFHEYTKSKPTDGIAPFYLAKSFHDGCVYKLETPDDSGSLALEEAPVLRIKAEICGIIETAQFNVNSLENDLISSFKLSEISTPWEELERMNTPIKIQICTNVMKKVHMKYIIVRRRSAYNIFNEDHYSYKLKLDHRGLDNIPITVLKCSMEKVAYHPSLTKTFYITKSPRMGCVYSLSMVKESLPETLLKIDNLICDVYPTRYLLHIDSRTPVTPSA